MRKTSAAHVSMMTSDLDRVPFKFAGFTADSWAFALRIWFALVVALYVSFWLNLEAPSTTALTIAVLAFPSRGQAAEKALFRIMATGVGVTAAILITGIFAQSGVFILVAFAAWMGLCVYLTSLFDGNRAYAAALCGTTVALIAMPQLDSPQMVFQAGMARGAAIAIGVLAVTFVNDFFAAPDFYPKVARDLARLNSKVAALVKTVTSDDFPSPIVTATLLHDITALRPQIASLAPESTNGHARAAAARSAVVELVTLLFLARATQALWITQPGDPQVRLVSPVDRPLLESDLQFAHHAGVSPALIAMCHAWLMERLSQTSERLRQSLSALNASIYPPHRWRTPLYRLHALAFASGVRAALSFLLIALLLTAAGWPTTASCLSLVGVLIGISATTPDVRAFTTLAAVAAPVSCLLVGILEFVILDGVTDFPLLAIGIAPFIIGSALLISTPSLILSSLGRANLVFTIAVFAPSNPQSYNPQTYLFTSLFLCFAAFALFVTQYIVRPLTAGERRGLLIDAARRDVAETVLIERRGLSPEEAIYRDASRIGMIVAAGERSDDHKRSVDQALTLIDQAAVLRLCNEQLILTEGGRHNGFVKEAIAALQMRDRDAVLSIATRMREAPTHIAGELYAMSSTLVLFWAMNATSPSVGADASQEALG
ncbi:FUSC family protein [Tardiphaga sp. 866_E4_N2_1]|uniref:FUSC family protein n=1 Tax=unclassified Tardiphaga TaxID=2631404 RepID=UPI003F25DB85